MDKKFKYIQVLTFSMENDKLFFFIFVLTWHVECSSTMAILLLDAERSRHRIAEGMDRSWTGKGLSTKIFKIWPFFRPRRRPSRSGGPPTTFFSIIP